MIDSVRGVHQADIPGLPFTQGIRDLVLSEVGDERLPAPPDPSVAGQVRAFIDWLRAVPPHSATGLPRYLQAIYNERDDVQQIFPEVRSGILDRFSWWVRTVGRAEHSSVRLLGDGVPPSREIPNLGRAVQGCDIVGFFSAEHGVGEAARQLATAITITGVEVSTINYTDTASRQRHEFPTDDVSRHRTLLMSINADHLRVARERLGDEFFANRYLVGQWFWELDTAPKWYRPVWPIVDELWAPTEFIADMLRKSAPRRVRVEHMPIPLSTPTIDTRLTRSTFGLDDRHMFLFVFDFLSVMKRKNPIGLVEAFSRAFRPGEGPVLVIKCINGERRPAEFAEMMRAAGQRDDIVVIDRYFSRTETSTLISLCDCYVSLHRSEGLGLTCAEAMALGRPVIATGYSGNLDFMTRENSILVPWSRQRVGANAEGYDPGAHWAAPDLDAAAAEMREVVADPDHARLLGKRAAESIARDHSPAATGARMGARLREIAGMSAGR